MTQLGIGPMLHQLSGGSEHTPHEFYGRVILAAAILDNRLTLDLDGGQSIQLWDNGQSCCESRYITCDDDLSKIIGGTLRRIEVKESRDTEGEYGEIHESVFIEVGTDECFVTLCTHNEHNGYYGGFALTITSSKA